LGYQCLFSRLSWLVFKVDNSCLESPKDDEQKVASVASSSNPAAETNSSDILATVNDILKSQEEPEEEEEEGETVSFKVMFCKTKHEVTFGLDKTIGKLKLHLQKITGQFWN